MDSLLTAAVEEVALEGRAGCSPCALWTRLEERGVTLPDIIKPFVWQQLRAMPDQIQFSTSGLLGSRCAGVRGSRIS